MNIDNIPQNSPHCNLPVTPPRIPSRKGLRGVVHHLLAAVNIIRNEMPGNAALNAMADVLNRFIVNLRQNLRESDPNGGAQ